jgi:hypothetical protein
MMRPLHFHIKPSTPYRCFANSLQTSYGYIHRRSSQQALLAPSNVESPASSAAKASNGPDFVQHRLSLFDRLLAEQKTKALGPFPELTSLQLSLEKRSKYASLKTASSPATLGKQHPLALRAPFPSPYTNRPSLLRLMESFGIWIVR